MSETPNTKGQPGLVEAALLGLCPECGAKTLFVGPAKFAEQCGNCGLDYAAFNVGDGPAAFLTMGLGAIIIILAVMLELAAHPPFWVHALIWVPLTCALVVLSLRVSKGALLIAEHRNRAIEGKLAEKSEGE
ncbi:DUF983 domain-containing protein [Sphingorhabdus sp.]|jgi:uncharacterized protein (DUF983 family)|uniref:DUF983 domain-containing protein n=1 Tax=Sphingorhabdus sp. TaxID=1902408 RepID=UPI002CF88BCA|nr:DUF983 domain-containing protein [Sphingorhabdus sp.]HMT42629.1 DUF983 domain-containing protein [Sphingorhabdus sp.]